MLTSENLADKFPAGWFKVGPDPSSLSMRSLGALDGWSAGLEDDANAAISSCSRCWRLLNRGGIVVGTKLFG